MRDGDIQDVIVTLRYATAVPRFGLVISADPNELAAMRASLRRWLETNQIVGSRHNDVLLSVGEAAAKAIEHTFTDTPHQRVDVRAALRNGMLTVTISATARGLSNAGQLFDRFVSFHHLSAVLLVDLTAVTYIDSAGLTLINRLAFDHDLLGGSLGLAYAPGSIADGLFTICPLPEYVPHWLAHRRDGLLAAQQARAEAEIIDLEERPEGLG